jgi:hypothetical protein
MSTIGHPVTPDAGWRGDRMVGYGCFGAGRPKATRDEEMVMGDKTPKRPPKPKKPKAPTA